MTGMDSHRGNLVWPGLLSGGNMKDSGTNGKKDLLDMSFSIFSNECFLPYSFRLLVTQIFVSSEQSKNRKVFRSSGKHIL